MKERQLLIIPVYNNSTFIERGLQHLLPSEEYKILIVDDASTDGTEDLMTEFPSVTYIKRELSLGFGACFITAYEYARDMGYERIIVTDPNNGNMAADIKAMAENLEYGYDIVSCSRILENYDARSMDKDVVAATENIASALRDITDIDLTDPLSPIVAMQMKALETMELTDYSPALLLQLWIQAAHFRLTTIEVPAVSGDSFGRELTATEDPLGTYLSVMETERYLYPRETMN